MSRMRVRFPAIEALFRWRRNACARVPRLTCAFSNHKWSELWNRTVSIVWSGAKTHHRGALSERVLSCYKMKNEKEKKKQKQNVVRVLCGLRHYCARHWSKPNHSDVLSSKRRWAASHWEHVIFNVYSQRKAWGKPSYAEITLKRRANFIPHVLCEAWKEKENAARCYLALEWHSCASYGCTIG